MMIYLRENPKCRLKIDSKHECDSKTILCHKKRKTDILQ